jgi:polysaccharide export outer membrane protein
VSSQLFLASAHQQIRRFALAVLVAVIPFVVLGTVRGNQAQTAAESYVIGPQDVLSITCANDPAVSGKFTVPADGFIGLMYIGSVKVAGLTARDAEDAIKERYKKAGTFLDPAISVSVETYKSQKVIIQGEVRTPGSYTLTGGMTLMELVASAGSMLSTASGEITIVRFKGDKPDFVYADLGQLGMGTPDARIPMHNGDLVLVTQADRAYIIGEVKNPNGYPVQRQTTLMQLLSLAGGPTADAAIGRIKIIRTVKGKQTEIKNAKQTELIKPGDTVVVPIRYF